MSYVSCSPNGLAVRLAWLALLACGRAGGQADGYDHRRRYVWANDAVSRADGRWTKEVLLWTLDGRTLDVVAAP